MKVTNPCEGSNLKTTNPISGEYFKISVCTHCKGLRGVTWDYKIRRFKFHTHVGEKEGK
jgi:hypothetical protein